MPSVRFRVSTWESHKSIASSFSSGSAKSVICNAVVPVNSNVCMNGKFEIRQRPGIFCFQAITDLFFLLDQFCTGLDFVFVPHKGVDIVFYGDFFGKPGGKSSWRCDVIPQTGSRDVIKNVFNVKLFFIHGRERFYDSQITEKFSDYQKKLY